MVVRGWQQQHEPYFLLFRQHPGGGAKAQKPLSLIPQKFPFQQLKQQQQPTSTSLGSANSSSDDNTAVSLPRGGGGGGERTTTSSTSNNSNETKLWTLQFARQLLAETVGTFILMFLGLGAVMSAVYTNSLAGLWQVAVVWAIAVTIAVATTGPISGAHLNPAISIALAVYRSFGWARVVPYCLAQLVGAVLGTATTYALYSNLIQEFEATNKIIRSSTSAIASAKAFGEYFVPPVTRLQAFFAESIGTAILAGVVFALTHPDSQTTKDNIYIPPLIGLTVGALVCVVAPLSQAGFNPARDFGPRIVAYLAGWREVAFRGAWLYVVAPIVGALLGALFVEKMLYPSKETRKTP